MARKTRMSLAGYPTDVTTGEAEHSQLVITSSQSADHRSVERQGTPDAKGTRRTGHPTCPTPSEE
jgi:hypothetical protein